MQERWRFNVAMAEDTGTIEVREYVLVIEKGLIEFQNEQESPDESSVSSAGNTAEGAEDVNDREEGTSAETNRRL